jgi:hypothetical protein
LHILSRIAEDDLPYDEIVLGDWTMANELLGGAWPVDYVDTYGAEATGWQLAHYTDGRPAAGLLATNGMWWRYMTNTSNANRGRANAVSRILLCSDYLTRPIAFDRDVNLLDQGAVNDALRTNSGCVACHNTLDPLASYFWGFYYVFYDSKIDTTEYHADREYTWQSVTGVEPGYYGLPGSSLADLGRHIAEDPRLYSCVTEQVFSLLNRRSVVLEDTGSLLEHAATFAADDYRLRSLFRSVMAGSEYRSAPSDDPRMTSSKMVSADLMASQIEDLTGFHFDYAGYDMLRTDTYGLRTLAGGVDGVYNLQPALEPTATMMLVQERLAEAAADYVVGQDRASPATARLFTEVGFLETPDTNADAMVRQVQLLHLRVLGNRVAADGPEVEANLELWNELFAATGSIPDAWEGLLATLMRDPDFLLY